MFLFYSRVKSGNCEMMCLVCFVLDLLCSYLCLLFFLFIESQFGMVHFEFCRQGNEWF